MMKTDPIGVAPRVRGVAVALGLALCPATLNPASAQPFVCGPGSEFPCPGVPPPYECVPGPCPDVFPTEGAFRIRLLNGTVFGPFVLADPLFLPTTVIGRSDPFPEGAEPGYVPVGVHICLAGAPPYSATASCAVDPCRIPSTFPEGGPLRREVHTEILSLELVDNPADPPNAFVLLRAGQAYFDSVIAAGTPAAVLYRNSRGEVASLSDTGVAGLDFPATSVFNLFVEIEIRPPLVPPPLPVRLYNKTPLVLTAPIILTFPPDFTFPGSQYVHDPSFVVPLFNDFGVPVGHLLSAAHGAEPFGVPEDAALTMPCPVSFAVDAMSMGLPPVVSVPNDVFADFLSTPPEVPVTVYRAPAGGVSPTGFPNITNAAVPRLSGLVTGAPDFVPGDAINSMSFGRDGTGGDPGTLYFSVSRGSVGVVCTDVWHNTDGPLDEAAADVYGSGVPAFGAYDDTATFRAPPFDNILSADSTELGLRPLLAPPDQDNVTGLELSLLDNSPPGTDLFYGTFTGPSFAGAEATIYVHDPTAGSFAPGSLAVFATAADLGLGKGDVVDALVLSDVNDVIGTTPPAPDGLLEVDQDEVLFSLAPGSPSLAGFSPADILYSDFDGSFVLFAPAAQLGLLVTDDVDAADIKPIALTPCPAGGSASGGHSSCCQAHPTPGCDDPHCQQSVCSLIPLCCFVEWDATCADIAQQLCGDLCAGGCLDPHPAPGCDDPVCAQAVCQVIPQCCQVAWDQICADQASFLCTPGCFNPHVTPGCDEPDCCELVCSVLPSCCTDAWDQACVHLAQQLCVGKPCDVTCPPGALLEPEACGADTNGGCNSVPPAYTPIGCGETVCGSGWAAGGSRDTDWYLLDVEDPDGDGEGEVSVELTSEFPAVVFILADGEGCPRSAIPGEGSSIGCLPGTTILTVPAPATYRLVVAPGEIVQKGGGIQTPIGLFDGVPCAMVGNEYLLTVSCGCQWDCGVQDGIVNIIDFLSLLAQWGIVGASCDFDGGGVNIVDFLKLLANWGICP